MHGVTYIYTKYCSLHYMLSRRNTLRIHIFSDNELSHGKHNIILQSAYHKVISEPHGFTCRVRTNCFGECSFKLTFLSSWKDLSDFFLSKMSYSHILIL